ncbi:hypothetical protein ACIP9H_33865 [Streptomyces sp. NPDC088732]|uniref:hypothetical protein n=1 Tax=Streptomyces sp. NPDC088732 TaxID=3365879 RepID=UPI0037F6205F
MTDQSPRHPVTVTFDVSKPVCVTDLATLATVAQELAHRLDAGTLFLGQQVVDAGDRFTFTLTGTIPPAPDEDDPLTYDIGVAEHAEPIAHHRV